MFLSNSKKLLPMLAITLACTPIARGAFAQSFASGNLVVSRVGDGSAALSSAGTAIFLDQFTAGGTLVNSFNVSTAATNSGTNYSHSGSATSEGFLTRSTGGNFYTIQGYSAAVGTAGVVGTTSTAVPRTVAVIGNGTSNFSTQLTDSYSGNNIRSSVYDNANALGTGSLIYTGGTATTNGGVRQTTLGATTATTTETAITNVRNVNIFNNTLYASSSSGTFNGINQINNDGTTSLITSGTTGTRSLYDFVFTDANTLYAADDSTLANGGGLLKFTRGDTNTFAYQYTLSGQLTNGLRGLTYDAASTTFYATTADATNATSGNKLVSVVDAGASSSFTTVATAAGNTAFRGVELSIAPVPAPPGVVSAGLGLAITALGAFRRRRKA